jgi:hypothetical protein
VAGADTVQRYFRQIDAKAEQQIAAHGWGLVAAAAGEKTFRHLQKSISDQMERILNKEAGPQGSGTVSEDLQKYFDFVDAIYSNAIPGHVNALWTPLHRQFLDAVAKQDEEYFRQFFIKYGESSERLNFFEMYINNTVFTGSPTGTTIPFPIPWEPILRASIIGYQSPDHFRSAEASSPVYQLGLTHYLFGNSWISQKLNHVGMAAAYEFDLRRHIELGGVVLHVRTFDFGVLCSSMKCREPVILASKNLQILRKPFHF